MVAKKNTHEAQDIAFEERVARLQEIVNALEQGNITLADSINLYKEGLNHTKLCRQELEKARHEIQVLTNASQTENTATENSTDVLQHSYEENAPFATSNAKWEDFTLDDK